MFDSNQKRGKYLAFSRMTDLALWQRQPADDFPTVLLVHGLTGNSRTWSAVVGHLSPETGFAAPDLRGRGASWELPGPYGIRRHADDLAALVEKLGIAPVVIAGYSMGAYVGTVFATRHPNLTRAVVAVDGGLRVEVPDDLEDEEALDLAVGPSLSNLALRFASGDEYLAAWGSHPAHEPYLDQLWEPSPGYDLAGSEPELRLRTNRDAVLQDGTDLLFDKEVIGAAHNVAVQMTLLTVDHGMFDQPGGFISNQEAENLVAKNANAEWRRFETLNHSTLMLGNGAKFVARAIEDLIA